MVLNYILVGCPCTLGTRFFIFSPVRLDASVSAAGRCRYDFSLFSRSAEKFRSPKVPLVWTRKTYGGKILRPTKPTICVTICMPRLNWSQQPTGSQIIGICMGIYRKVDKTVKMHINIHWVVSVLFSYSCSSYLPYKRHLRPKTAKLNRLLELGYLW